MSFDEAPMTDEQWERIRPGRRPSVQEPTCTTCGGTKRVMDRDSDDEYDTVPCPVCAVPNPEPGDGE